MVFTGLTCGLCWHQDWYPDQEETEAGGEEEEVEAAVEEGEVAADNATSTDDAAVADNATATEAAPADATAAQSSHTQMLASVKSVGKQHGRIEDPEEWLQNNVGAKFSAIKGGVKSRVKQLLASSTPHHSNRIPDPVTYVCYLNYYLNSYIYYTQYKHCFSCVVHILQYASSYLMPRTAGGMDGGALSQTQAWRKELGTHAIALTTEDAKRRHSTALAAPQESVLRQLSYAVRGLGKGIH